MERHTDEKGGLKGKFEDYSFTPRDQVWDRIAAGPGQRPLGALFWAFAWMPNARVWKRISAELHPVPVLRIASWSAAAAAAVALFAWLQWGGLAGATQEGDGLSSGKGLAAMDFQGSWSERLGVQKDGLENGAQGKVSDLLFGQAREQDGMTRSHDRGATAGMHSPKSKGHSNLKDPRNRHYDAGGNEDRAHASVFSNTQFTELSRPIVNISTGLQDINRRTTQIVAIEMDRQRMEVAAREAAFNEWEEHQQRAESAGLIAQAGTSLAGAGAGPGNQKGFLGLREYAEPFNSNNISAAVDQASERVSDENFSTPVVIGAGVDHRIVGKLGIGGGLVYTRMQSYQEGTYQNVMERQDVTRQYLGLNTNLNYNLPLSKRNDRLAAYGAAGLQYDFGLSKQTKITTTRSGQVVDRANLDQALGGQASINAGVGLQYKLYRSIGLYVQANAARYFYASEANLYTGRGLMPSMQVGLRVRL